MKLKIIAFILSLIVFILFCSCAKSGGNESTSAAEENEASFSVKEDSTTQIAAIPDIIFEARKAEFIAAFPSEIYGRLNIFLQDGFFLIYDDYANRRFTLFAQGYKPENVSDVIDIEFRDLNFDGFEDFRLLYNERGANKYYLCYLWDVSEMKYNYLHDLSLLPSPEFDRESGIITAYNREESDYTTVSSYQWSMNGLVQISQRVEESDNSAPAFETVDARMTYTNDSDTLTITLSSNENSVSKWLALAEHENIISVSSAVFDSQALTYTFTLKGISDGVTTILFRYAKSMSSQYVEEIVLNASVQNGIIHIIPIE